MEVDPKDFIKIKKLIDATAHQKHRNRHLSRVKYQIWHRSHLGPEFYDGTPESYIDFWSNKKYGTGGRVPYHYLIKKDGLIWHLIPHDKIGPAASPKNTVSINVAIERDMRKFAPTRAQWRSAKFLARNLFIGGAVAVGGHSEIAPKKDGSECPGKKLDLAQLRQIATFGEWEEERI